MKKDLLFKPIALGAMVVGGVSLATAAVTRFRRMKDERAAADAIVEAEVIKENFSGFRGFQGLNQANYPPVGTPCNTALRGDVPNLNGTMGSYGRCLVKKATS